MANVSTRKISPQTIEEHKKTEVKKGDGENLIIMMKATTESVKTIKNTSEPEGTGNGNKAAGSEPTPRIYPGPASDYEPIIKHTSKRVDEVNRIRGGKPISEEQQSLLNKMSGLEYLLFGVKFAPHASEMGAFNLAYSQTIDLMRNPPPHPAQSSDDR